MSLEKNTTDKTSATTGVKCSVNEMLGITISLVVCKNKRRERGFLTKNLRGA